VAHTFLAADHNIKIIPVLNKIDMPAADVETVKKQIEDILAIPAADALQISAKTGQGVEAVLEAIVEHIPPPTSDPKAPLGRWCSIRNTTRSAAAWSTSAFSMAA